jgi:lipoprotein-anchoring transpeptidase ErfK/SrfK
LPISYSIVEDTILWVIVMRFILIPVMLIWFILCLGIFNPHTLYAEEEEVYLLVKKKYNLLYVILNDVPVYTFRVATGRGGLTPIGEFKIVTKIANPFYMPKRISGGHPDNPLGSRWMGLSVGNGYKYGIHGTKDPYSIGSSVSSGCIRMRNKDIEFLFRHIPLKTRVVIVPD